MEIKDLENKITCADCMDILKQLPDKCIDLVLTDPPYGGGGKNLGNITKMEDLEAYSPNISVTRTGGSWSKKYQQGGIFDHNNIKNWDYAPSEDVFKEIFRVSKNQIIWGGNYFNLPPTRCFNIWKKLTISESFSMAMAEYAWTSFNDNAKLWEFAPQDPNRFHPTQKPVGLIMKQVALYSQPDDLILDCFSGSGTTAIACHKLKRRFICIEKDKDYYEASVKRLEEEQRQMDLF